MNWTGGTLAGNNTTILAPTNTQFAISGGNTKILDSRSFNLSGAVTWTGAGNIDLRNGALLLNQSGATFAVQTDASILAGPGLLSPRFLNLGTVRKETTTGTTAINVFFDNSGTLVADRGTVRLGGASNTTGSISVALNSRLTFGAGNHSLAGSSSLTGAGAVSFTEGTVQMDGAYTVANTEVSGGTLAFPPDRACNEIVLPNFTFLAGTLLSLCPRTLAVTNQLRIGDTNPVVLPKILDQVTLANRGTNAIWSGVGDLTVRNAAGLANDRVTARFDSQSNARLVHGGGANGQFSNAGTLLKTVTNTNTRVEPGVTFTNNAGAAIDVQNGTLTIAEGTITGGIAGNGQVTFRVGTVQVNGPYTVTGGTRVESGIASFVNVTPLNLRNLTLAGGRLTSTGPINLLGTTNSWTGGDLAGSGLVTVPVANQLTVSGTEEKTLVGRTLRNEGTVLLDANGELELRSGAAITNELNALFRAVDTSGLFWVGGLPASFLNRGRVLKNGQAGGGVGYFRLPFTNEATGLVEVETNHRLFLADTFTNFRNDSLIGGRYDVRGQLQFFGADLRTLGRAGTATEVTLRGVGPHFVDQFGDDGLRNFGTLAASAILRLNLVPLFVPPAGLLIEGSFVVQGGSIVTWSGGAITGVISVEPGGTLNLYGDTVIDGRTGGRVENRGTMGHYGSGSVSLMGGGRVINRGGGGWPVGGLLAFRTDSAFAYFGENPAADRLVNEGDALFEAGAAPAFDASVDWEQRGALSLREGAWVAFGGTLTLPAGATLDLGGGTLSAAGVEIQAGAMLLGPGYVAGNVTNAGRVTVAGGQTTGILVLDGNYTQLATGTLALRLGAPGEVGYDQLSVSGTATLAGTLDLGLMPGYRGRVDDYFELLYAGTLTGQFETIRPPAGLEPGLSLVPYYEQPGVFALFLVV